MHCFTITNRRLGKINITVEKSWIDGNGSSREELKNALSKSGLNIAVHLKFMTSASLGLEDIYKITKTGYGNESQGDTVTISTGNTVKISDNNGMWVDSIQNLDLSQKNQTIYFWNLPKYDGNGASVRYNIDEIFVDANGTEITNTELNTKYPDVVKAYEEYRLSTDIGK